MIYYPLTTLMLAGIREILIISTPFDLPKFRDLLGNGKKFGVNFYYKEQPEPKGIAEAFLLGEHFIGESNVCLILGDNLFYGHEFSSLLTKAVDFNDGGKIFGYWVKNPNEFGVVEFDKNHNATRIEEKPKNPKSNYAVPGLYFYDNQVISIVKNLKSSPRGELEITDVNNAYLKMNKLKVGLFGRGIAWLDTGTPENLIEAGQFIATIEKRQGLKIGCPEEVAYRKKFITKKDLQKIVDRMPNNSYKKYLLSVLKFDDVLESTVSNNIEFSKMI
jgi:glucose-1-phosphate thymidylyltransferase